MKEIIQKLSGSQLALIIILILITITVTLSYILSGLVAAILYGLIIASILFITKPVWNSPTHGITKVRQYSILAIITLVSPYVVWVNPQTNKLLTSTSFLGNVVDQTQVLLINRSLLSVVLGILGILIINYFIRDRTVMGIHAVPIANDFPEPDFPSQLDSIAKALIQDLERIEAESRWDQKYYIPLEAQLEVIASGKRKKQIVPLIEAIRSDSTSQTFLIIGDPGSGKSVALRKLCVELLKEARRTLRLPIYVNLREWSVNEKWTEENPPTSEQLKDFIFRSLKGKREPVDRFLDKYYSRLVESGRIFFVFDSFDEIPVILDTEENSKLIDIISDRIYCFMSTTYQCRGILSSRPFRKPTSSFRASAQFEIRPFTELKISEHLKHYGELTEYQIKTLFTEHRNWIPIIGNPFVCTLLANYVREKESFPLHQVDLYEHFISSRLESQNTINQIQKRKLTNEEVFDTCIKLATFMMNKPEFGFEASVRQLEAAFPNQKLIDVIEVLWYGQLARKGTQVEPHFSFTHRRFAEYFYVQHLLKSNSPIQIDSIPTDSRGRDSLVLYCEVCEEEQAKAIANQCWKLIKEYRIDFDNNYVKIIHLLRFINDSFRSRKSVVKEFSFELFEMFQSILNRTENMLVMKHAVECSSVLESEQIQAIVYQSLRTDNAWIKETSIKMCKTLSSIDEKIINEIEKYILNSNILYFVNTYKTNVFSFSLSEGFSKTVRVLKNYFYSFLICYASVIFLVFTNYNEIKTSLTLVIEYVLFAEFLHLMFPSHKRFKNIYKYRYSMKYLKYYLITIGIITSLYLYIDVTKNINMLYSLLCLLVSSSLVVPHLLLDYSKKYDISFIKKFSIWLFNNTLFNIMKLPEILQKFFRKTLLQKITILFKLFVSIIGLFFVILLIIVIFKFFEISMLILSSVYFTSLAVWLLLLIKQRILQYLNDKKIIDSVVGKLDYQIDRCLLSTIFFELQGESGKRKLIAMLNNRKVKLTGNWGEDFNPHRLISNDIAIELVKLDEKHLGLN